MKDDVTCISTTLVESRREHAHGEIQAVRHGEGDLVFVRPIDTRIHDSSRTDSYALSVALALLCPERHMKRSEERRITEEVSWMYLIHVRIAFISWE